MNAAAFLASGFGAGYAPRAPGTVGSVLGLAIGAALLAAGSDNLPLVFGILVASGLGVWAIENAGEGAADPGWVVIDEIAGQMIAMLALSHVRLLGLVLAFALFRLFDITKWGPIGWADARHDAWGVMGDDWIAGLFAMIVVLGLRLLLPAGWL